MENHTFFVLNGEKSLKSTERGAEAIAVLPTLSEPSVISPSMSTNIAIRSIVLYDRWYLIHAMRLITYLICFACYTRYIWWSMIFALHLMKYDICVTFDDVWYLRYIYMSYELIWKYAVYVTFSMLYTLHLMKYDICVTFSMLYTLHLMMYIVFVTFNEVCCRRYT